MYRYFNANDTQRYTDVLQDLVDGYNNSYHRSIGMKPIDVTRENQEQVRQRLYPPTPIPREKALAVGTKVMISTNKRVFQKGFETTFQPQVYEISKRINTSPLTYFIVDMSGTQIEGAFYGRELQVVSKELETYVVERVIRRRVKDGQRQCYIKWSGYGPQHNSWVPESALFFTDAEKKS